MPELDALREVDRRCSVCEPAKASYVLQVQCGNCDKQYAERLTVGHEFSTWQGRECPFCGCGRAYSKGLLEDRDASRV